MKFKNPFKPHIILIDDGTDNDIYLIRRISTDGWKYYVSGGYVTSDISRARVYRSLEHATKGLVELREHLILLDKKRNPKVIKTWWS